MNKEEESIHKVLMAEKEMGKLQGKEYKAIRKFANTLASSWNNVLKEEFNKHEGKRVLKANGLKENNVIGLFDSTLTRTLGMKIDEVSLDILSVRIYHYDILEDLIKEGFTLYDKENDKYIDYIYYTSSAGNIREKKSMYIRKDKWEKHKDTLTNGLSRKMINENGGMITNKYQSYLAMNGTASVPWNGFDIDKVVVVPDLEMDVEDAVDYIDKDSYKITPNIIKSLPMEVNDGCGLILPDLSKKNMQFRLPWCKGLLASYDFKAQAKLHGNTEIIDIYDKTYDVLKDNIQIIMTKSQFKASKYYINWDDYKQKFKDNKCEAVIVSVEGDTISDSTTNYQFLQSLTHIEDSELEKIASGTIKEIELMGNDKQTMLESLGVDVNKKNLNHFQESLLLYPELLNDTHSKEIIKSKRRSMIKKARAGKLSVDSKYTYILPDLYEFTSWLFTGVATPLLSKEQVFCNLYDSGKVSIARSPHLYREHGIKQNVVDNDKAEWFKTNALYISNRSMLPKLLMADFDGDKVTVFAPNSIFVDVAERNMLQDKIIPLYYKEPKSEPQDVNDDNIYDNLINSYKINIGAKSNEITKFWNNDHSNLDIVKWLTFENNMQIDYAKNLWLPTRPPEVDKKIKAAISGKVPNFFKYAKNKKPNQVAPINKSTVNKLFNIVPAKRIDFEDIAGEFDYKQLMSNPNASINKRIVVAYKDLDQNKKWRMNSEDDGKGKMFVYKLIRKDLLKINSDPYKVADVLIKHLYENNDSQFKTTLWESFGKEILHNLKYNLKNTRQCEDCGSRIAAVTSKKYCSACAR